MATETETDEPITVGADNLSPETVHEERFERKIEDAKLEGWELKERAGDKAIMIRRKKGTLGTHAVILLLTGWWTFGLGNLIYLAYKYFVNTDTKVVRAE